MNTTKNFFARAVSLVFKDPLFIVLALSAALNMLAVYYLMFLQVTTLRTFFDSNVALYNWLSVVLTVLISLAFGIILSFLIWQMKKKKALGSSQVGNSFIGSFLGALSVGCPTCGAYLASVLGISGGLFAFPFQGLEVKIVSLGLMGFTIAALSKSIDNQERGICEITAGKGFWRFLRPNIPSFVGFLLLILVAYLPQVANKFNFNFVFQKSLQASLSEAADHDHNSHDHNSLGSLLEEINPPQGFAIKASYGDIGPRLLAAGVIDFEEMKKIYEQAGQPLTAEQIKILTEGSDEKIKITPENSYFLLNFFWALGLANKNIILDDGPMAKYGKDKIGYFASTGGWTLGKKDATDYYSKFEWLKLTPDRQKTLEDFANNSYRPCCSNPVAFPDCNHGMAALGLGELMASQGASVDEIFEAFKYFNSFWFPQTYLDVANYFQAKEGKNWSQVPGRIVAGQDYSTPQGWQRVRQWLSTNGLLEEAPSGGGGCGV